MLLPDADSLAVVQTATRDVTVVTCFAAKRSKTVDPSATITSVSMTTVAPPNGAKPRAPDPPVTVAMVQPIMADVLYDNIPAQRGGPIALSELAVYVEQNEAKKFGFMVSNVSESKPD